MTKHFKLLSCSLLTGAALWLAPAIQADEWDKRTVLTFNAPVEIPGKTLEPGTYVFKLLNSPSNRTTVEVFTEDEKHLITTFHAIPDYRSDPPENTVVTFEERAAGSPEAIHTWFYPGDNYGLEFVYGKAIPQTPAPVPPVTVSAASAPAPVAPEVAAAPEPAPEPEQPTPAVIFVREEVVLIAQAQSAPVTEPQPEPLPAELPQTSGNFAIIPLAGLGLLGGGFTALRRAARQS